MTETILCSNNLSGAQLNQRPEFSCNESCRMTRAVLFAPMYSLTMYLAAAGAVLVASLCLGIIVGKFIHEGSDGQS
jgi:hypothetical protein